jgi:hypothetical protein
MKTCPLHPYLLCSILITALSSSIVPVMNSFSIAFFVTCMYAVIATEIFAPYSVWFFVLSPILSHDNALIATESALMILESELECCTRVNFHGEVLERASLRAHAWAALSASVHVLLFISRL